MSPNLIRTLSTARARLHAALEAANGRRRQRTLRHAHVLEALRAAREQGWGGVAAPAVAGSYAYPAWRTVIYAACTSRDHVRVWIDLRSALPGSSRYPLAAAYAERRGHAAHWAETATAGMLLSRRVVAHLLASAPPPVPLRRREPGDGRVA